jgi:hypothetical protein
MFQTTNYLEAVLWWVMGVVILVAGVRRREHLRPAIVGSLTLVAFGLSDVVEVQTGAWWRPWWLLVWKAGCVGVLLLLLIRHTRFIRRT